MMSANWLTKERLIMKTIRLLFLSSLFFFGTSIKSVLSPKIQYTIITPAPAGAASIKRFQKVTVHFTGWVNKKGKKGFEFDSSVRRGKPFSFYVGAGQVIAGWDQIIMDMKVGEKRFVSIPSELAYGKRGSSSSHIPPNTDLFFEIELIEAI